MTKNRIYGKSRYISKDGTIMAYTFAGLVFQIQLQRDTWWLSNYGTVYMVILPGLNALFYPE